MTGKCVYKGIKKDTDRVGVSEKTIKFKPKTKGKGNL